MATHVSETRVLVADAAAPVRVRLCALLAEQTGLSATGCGGEPDEVVRLFVQLAPDCVVFDAPAQRKAGFEALERLRALDPDCLLIVLTNHTTDEFARHSAHAGADCFLAKSTEFERVVDLVLELARRNR